ncbi:MAG: glycosyltransferase family 9 protein [Candidatus Omnitrophica bacterium]|nr:glycosyltransferase family 9 protein [Candidatus Omnitrophota bacterium]MDD5552692.1 glycosyltransferase family 9 protein [Candidatus Omnitrophota bacterium]
MKKFLICNPFGIGDILFTTPVIRAIKDQAPENTIGYWCNERAKGIIKNNPAIDRIFPLSRGDLKKISRESVFRGMREYAGLAFAIKREKYGTFLDFSMDHRYSLLAKLVGIKRRIGFDYKNRGRFLTDKITIEGYRDKHVVEHYLELLKPLGIEPKSLNLEINVPPDDSERAEEFLARSGVGKGDVVIGMAPGAGASWGKDSGLKHWPAENYGKLADRLIDNFQASVVLLGDESEKYIADIISANMKNRPANLTVSTSLEELCAIINELDVLITNDGGPLHIASALGKKTLSFFGPVDPRIYGPYPFDPKRHIVLRKQLECSPCYTDFRLEKCLRNKECLETIDVDSAFEAVKKLL